MPPVLRERREAEAVRRLPRDAERPPRSAARPVVPAQGAAVNLAQVQAGQVQVYE
ncbi:hypothetical protein GCM10018784_69160 [Streptomyces hydrogenans]|nr:hypothetical protein GCM10018784_69160 [Streptomyces hydrogenans]